jgi:hypothetical protein
MFLAWVLNAPWAMASDPAFTLEVKTDNAGTSSNMSFTLPLNADYSYNFYVDWGDTSSDHITSSASASLTHLYDTAGIKTVKITDAGSPGFPAIFFNSGGDCLKLLKITNWGDVTWATMNSAFTGCSNLTITATDEATAKTGAVTDFYCAWNGCSGLTSFPLLDTHSGTNFGNAWGACSGLASFPNLNTSAGTFFMLAWDHCSGLTSFPALDLSAGTNFAYAWCSCSGLTSFPALNTSTGTDFSSAWAGCTGLTSFPALNTSAGTNFSSAWADCTGLTSFPALDTHSGTSFLNTWSGCTGLTSFPALNTSAGTNFAMAWSGCSGLTSFPVLTTSAGTNFSYAWYGCTGLTSFPALDTHSGTSFSNTWYGCTGLTSFPALDTHSGTSFSNTWYGCTGLTSFPALNTNAGTDFSFAWYHCSGLTSFPALNTSAGTNFSYAWNGCTGLTSFPALVTSAGTNFSMAWYDCIGLISFPVLNTSAGTNFLSAWQGCSGLTSFPALDTSKGTNFSCAWSGCTGLTSFPALDTHSGTSFLNTWDGCTGLTSFPVLNTSAGTNFASAWYGCSGLTSFPALNTSAGTTFWSAWQGCSGLTSFPALNTSAGTTFWSAWQGCSGLTSFPILNTSAGTIFRSAWQDCSGLATFPTLNMGNMTNGILCFSGVTLSTTSYSNLLNDFAARNTNTSVIFNGGNSHYNSGAVAARNTTLITGRSWLISDGGLCGQRYRVGVGGNWSDTAHWSATSGGAGGAPVPTAYDVAIFDGGSSGTCTLDAPSAVSTLSLNGNNGTLAFGTNTLTVYGDADLRTSGSFTGTAGGLVVADTGTLSPPVSGTIPNLTISGGVTTLATNALAVAGSISIGSGATLNCGGMDIGVAGNWANAGTFTAGTGTVTLNGAGGSIQVVSGSTTFHNLTATCTVARTIQFTAGTTQTVTGALTLTGASGQLLSLRSTASPSTWSITPTGTLTCSYLDVKDGINTTALVIAPPQSADSGHNTQWFAPAAPAGSSKKGGCGLGGAFAMVLLLLSWRMALRRW